MSKKNDTPDPELSERSLIAASHRTNRSMEGRMESAMKASEVHYERTGKHFRITEETVKSKGPYEETSGDEQEEEKPTKKKSTHASHK